MNFTYEELTARLNGLKYELKCIEALTRLPKGIKQSAINHYELEICAVEDKLNDMRNDAMDILIEIRKGVKNYD